MAEIMTEHPVVDENGYLYYNLIKHYARDENGAKYSLIQNETGAEYEDPIDMFPCKYTYSIGSIVKELNEEEGNDVEEQQNPPKEQDYGEE